MPSSLRGLLAAILFATSWAVLATSAHARHHEPHLEVPSLALAQLALSGPQLALASSPQPAILDVRDVTASPPAQSRSMVGPILTTLFVSVGGGLALAGGFHVLRADDRAEGCHYPEEEVAREAEQRRVGWSFALVGTGTALTTLGVWTVQRLRGVAPPLTRAMRWSAAAGPLVVGTVAASLLWAGMTVRSVSCYSS